MDQDEYNRIVKKAKSTAAKFGFGDEAEDFAQEYALKCFTSGKHQKLDWAIHDYSTKLRANKRVLSSPSGYLSKNARVSIDQPCGPEGDDGPTIGDTLGEFRDCVGINSELGELGNILERIFGLVKSEITRKEIRDIYMTWIEENV